MNAALEVATAQLELAKEMIDAGSVNKAEIFDILNSAQKMVDRSREITRLEAVQAAGMAALDEIEHLEAVRRLLAYGIAHGRCGKEATRLHDLLASRPQIDKTKGLPSGIKAFSWLNSNRKQITQLLAATQTPEL